MNRAELYKNAQSAFGVGHPGRYIIQYLDMILSELRKANAYRADTVPNRAGSDPAKTAHKSRPNKGSRGRGRQKDAH